MKAQAALEFLMTYGWAILIVIAVVAALYMMGVFKLPGGGLGRISPNFPPGSGIAYNDHNANTLVLTVGPSQINNTRVFNADTGAVIAPTTGLDTTAHDPGATFSLGCVTAGCFSGNVPIIVEYEDTGSGLYHNVTATLHSA